MLFIELNDGCTIEWHVGDKLQIWQPIDPAKPRRMAVEVEADGDELDFIAKKFSNIPMTTGRSVVWTGDMARFICKNL